MRYLLVTLISCVTLGCSTIHTVSNANEGLVMKGSYCESINHMFSGIQYNWCKLHGSPKDNADSTASKGEFNYVGIDSAFSLVGDVIVLPYTIYKQASSDPIPVWSSDR